MDTQAPPQLALRRYQYEGATWLTQRTRSILGDAPGVGKTATALCSLDEERHPRVVVVAPLSVCRHWESEVSKWRPQWRPFVAIGSAAARKKVIAAAQDATAGEGTEPFGRVILITNYETVRGKDLELLLAFSPNAVLLDEAHRVKDRRTKTFAAIKDLTWSVPKVICITGTPILNRVEELWSLLNLCDPKRWSAYWKFVDTYCNTPEAPIWMADYSFRPLGDIVVGDEVMGWVNTPGRGRRKRVPATVLNVMRRKAEIVRVVLESGQVVRCTPDHLWLSPHHNVKYPFVAAKVGRELQRMIIPTPPAENQFLAGWLGGIYDGEGSRVGISQSATTNPDVHAEIGRALKELGIPFRMGSARTTWPYILAGVQAQVDFLNKCDPIRRASIERYLWEHPQPKAIGDRVVAIEPDGVGEVVSLTTTTGNYVAWGYASKNCDTEIVQYKSSPQPTKIVRGMLPGVDIVLRQELRDIMIRRESADVLPELPDITVVEHEIDLSPPERKYYDQMAKFYFTSIEEEDGNLKQVVAPNDVARITRLRQLSCDASVFDPDLGVSSKLKALAELVDDIGEPVVVFSTFSKVIDRVAAVLDQPVGRITGDVPGPERQAVIEAFAAGNIRVIAGTIRAMGEGIDKLQLACRRVIFLDQDWTPSWNEQAVARVRRMGQTEPVFVHQLVARETIDQYVAKVLRAKQDVFDTLVGRSYVDLKAIVKGQV